MSSNKPKWIVFDMGGVIYDSPKAFASAAKFLDVTLDELLDAYFIDFEEVEVSKKHYHEKVQDIITHLKKTHNPTEVASVLFDLDMYVKDTLYLISQLHNSGYKTALLTNTWHGITNEVTAKLKEYRLIDKIFDSSDIGMRKPNKEIFDYLEENTGVNGRDIFFVDDRDENIEEAKKHDWQTFLYSLGDDLGETSNNLLRGVLLKEEN